MADSFNTHPKSACSAQSGVTWVLFRGDSWVMGVALPFPGSVTWARPCPSLNLWVVVVLCCSPGSSKDSVQPVLDSDS